MSWVSPFNLQGSLKIEFLLSSVCKLLSYSFCAYFLAKKINDLALHLAAQHFSLLPPFHHAFHNLLIPLYFRLFTTLFIFFSLLFTSVALHHAFHNLLISLYFCPFTMLFIIFRFLLTSTLLPSFP